MQKFQKQIERKLLGAKAWLLLMLLKMTEPCGFLNKVITSTKW